MKRLATLITALGLLTATSTASAAYPGDQSIADARANAHCAAVACDTHYLQRVENNAYPGGRIFYYYQAWWAYGFRCKLGLHTEPYIFVANNGAVTESGWGADNTQCS